jgi:hypothetical protein
MGRDPHRLGQSKGFRCSLRFTVGNACAAESGGGQFGSLVE